MEPQLNCDVYVFFFQQEEWLLMVAGVTQPISYTINDSQEKP